MPFPNINDYRGSSRRFSYEPSKRSLSDDEIIDKFKELIESPNKLNKPYARGILNNNDTTRMRQILQGRGFPLEHSEREAVTRKPKTFDDWKLVFKEMALPVPVDMNHVKSMLKRFPENFKGIRIEGEETANKKGEKSFIPALSKVIIPAKEAISDMENKKLSPMQELSGISDRHGLAPLHATSNAPERARSANPGRQRPSSPGNIAGDIATLGRANISRYPIDPEQFAPLKTEREVEWDNMIQAEAINRQAEAQNKKRAEDKSNIPMPKASDPDYVQFKRMNPALAAFQTNAFTTLQHALERSKPHVPAKPGLVEPVELERQANFLMHELHPDTPENVDQYHALTNILGRHAQSNAVAESAEPYLNELSKNPALRHKELMGDVERDFNRNILDESTREFNEKILPGIRDKYQTPGLRMHGHQGKNAEEAARRHGEGVTSALAKAGIGMRGTTLNAANAHAGNLAHAAGINQKAAAEDRTHNTEATKMLAEAQNKRTMNKAAWMTDARNVGQSQRLQLQKERDIANAQQKDIENHGLNNAMIAAKLAQGLPADQSISGVERLQTPMPETTKGNLESNIGQTLGGMGGSMFNRKMNSGHKKGGRIQKAVGGQVNPMQDVIQNAVIDKIDPVTELRRMLQHTQGIQGLQARQQLKIGGMVDPIKAGSEDARIYAGHDAMKNKLHRLRNPDLGRERSMADDFFEGANIDKEAMGGKSGVADVLRAIHRGYSSSQKHYDERHNARQGNLNEADELEYQLQQKLEEKAMKERDMLRLEKIANAQAAHHHAKAGGGAGGVGGVGGVKTTAALLKAKKDLNMQFNALLKYKRANEHVKKLAGTVDSGPMQDILPFNAQSYISPMLGLKGNTEERIKLKNAGNEVMNTYQALEKSGAGRSVLHLQQKKENKPGLTQFPAFNVSSPDEVIKGTDMELEDTIDLMKAYGFPEDVIARKIQQMVDPSVPLDEDEEDTPGTEGGVAPPSDAESIASRREMLLAEKAKRALQGKVA